jgi:hypothetical protein
MKRALQLFTSCLYECKICAIYNWRVVGFFFGKFVKIPVQTLDCREIEKYSESYGKWRYYPTFQECWFSRLNIKKLQDKTIASCAIGATVRCMDEEMWKKFPHF